MNLRVTLGLLFAAVLMGGYIYGIEVPREDARQAREASEKKLVQLSREDLSVLELPLKDRSERLRLVRDPNDADKEKWLIEAPARLDADPVRVQGLLTALLGLESEVVIESADRSEFGLEDGATEISFVAGDAEPTRLLLGDESPVGSLRYVALSTEPGRIFGVPQGSTATFDTDLFAVRSKSLLAVEPNDVVRLRVSRRGLPAVSVKRDPGADASSDAAWTLEEPLEDRADPGRVFRLLQDLYFARADSFVDVPGESAEYGLDTPEVELRLESTEGEGVTLALAGGEEDKVFARIDGKGPILELPERILDAVPRSVFEYRFKRVFSLRVPEVAGLELVFPREDRKIRFDREGKTWTAEPEFDVDPLRINDLLYELEALDATGIEENGVDLAALGLEPPRVRVNLSDAAGESMGWLALGDPETGGGTPSKSSGSDRIWRVVNDIAEDLPLDYATFENRWRRTPPDATNDSASSDGGDDAVSEAEAPDASQSER